VPVIGMRRMTNSCRMLLQAVVGGRSHMCPFVGCHVENRPNKMRIVEPATPRKQAQQNEECGTCRLLRDTSHPCGALAGTVDAAFTTKRRMHQTDKPVYPSTGSPHEMRRPTWAHQLAHPCPT
jgi:hypothetical protein